MTVEELRQAIRDVLNLAREPYVQAMSQQQRLREIELLCVHALDERSTAVFVDLPVTTKPGERRP